MVSARCKLLVFPLGYLHTYVHIYIHRYICMFVSNVTKALWNNVKVVIEGISIASRALNGRIIK